MKKVFFVALSLMLSYSCFAITITWVGGTGKWTRAANWSPAQVPGPNDRAIIPSGNVYLMNPTSPVNSIEIFSGARLYIQPGNQLQVSGSTASRSIDNSGQINNYGTLEVLNGTSPNSTGIYNVGTFFNRPGGFLLIEDMWRGFHNAVGGYANNEGTWNIDNTSSSGIFNQGLFVCLSVLDINDSYLGFLNNGAVVNQGTITIDDAHIGLYNQDDWNNLSPGELHINDYNQHGIQNTNLGVIENTNGIVTLNHTTGANDLFNTGIVHNLDCGEMYFSHVIRNISNGEFENEAWLFSTSTSNHVNGAAATFLNDGVIHDPTNAFASMNIQNNGVIVKPIAGPIYVNQPVANTLGLGSLSGFSIGYWVDPNISYKVGVYDNYNNEFTPGNDGIGLSEIAVEIGFASCSNRYLSIPISGGIQNSPSPFSVPDREQTIALSNAPLDIVAFPNPAIEIVNIQFPDLESSTTSYHIQLFDSSGKQLIQKKVEAEANTTTLNIQDFPSGLYTVCIIDQRGNKTIKELVIE